MFKLILIYLWSTACNAKIISYMITEHALVHFLNPKFLSFGNITSYRHGRGDKFYYVDVHLATLIPFDNEIEMNFYFYEYLSNQYKRSFVEMHMRWCDLVEKDPFFGAPMRQGGLEKPCPHPPGAYHLYNMTVSIGQIPFNFPFTKGRIYCNATRGKEDVFSGSVDMEIRHERQKQIKIKKKTLF